MKVLKGLSILLTCILFITISTVKTNAANVADPELLINNQTIPFTTCKLYNEVYMIPISDLAKQLELDYKFSLEDEKVKILTQGGNREIILALNSDIAVINGKNIKMPAPVIITDFRIFVPGKFISSLIDCNMYIDSLKNRIHIIKPSEGNTYYRINNGDTLWTISNAFGTTISRLKEYNNLSTDMIYPGHWLIVDNRSQAVNYSITGTTNNWATLFSTPSLSSKAVAYLKPGTALNIVEKSGYWYKVETTSGIGYTYYTVTNITQDIYPTNSTSSYFKNRIEIDTSGTYTTYTDYAVQKGDTLWSISQQFNVTLSDLYVANGFSSSTMLSIGQIVKIPEIHVAIRKPIQQGYGEILDWFEEAQYVFPIGKEAKITDIASGKSFRIKRTIGASHADVETLTAQDTAVMLEIFNSQWSWVRKPCLLEVDDRIFAVSISGMPHAGVDGAPFLKDVPNRSGDYGYGTNFDAISGNNMNGHFDLYFLNSLRHKDNQIDPDHQKNIMSSGGVH